MLALGTPDSRGQTSSKVQWYSSISDVPMRQDSWSLSTCDHCTSEATWLTYGMPTFGDADAHSQEACSNGGGDKISMRQTVLVQAVKPLPRPGLESGFRRHLRHSGLWRTASQFSLWRASFLPVSESGCLGSSSVHEYMWSDAGS